MSDYGHALQFGVFITPSAAGAGAVVDLAVLADASGLDLVTFQDHPYQARFLDAWTLLSAVAARTSRVHVAPNVLNLPLRPPAVVARAAASLDILSGGRFELGLGAGAFWDGIAAMGGPRRTPGESVDALEEAIDVIRALWDVERARRGPRRGHPLPARGRGARPCAGARHRRLDRRLQAADAGADRPQGRRLAAQPGLPGAGRPGRGQRGHRRGRGRRGPRPARDPPPAERQRRVLGEPPGLARRPAGAVGRRADGARAHRRRRDVHPRGRRPRGDRDLRGRGRARRARAGGRRARARWPASSPEQPPEPPSPPVSVSAPATPPASAPEERVRAAGRPADPGRRHAAQRRGAVGRVDPSAPRAVRRRADLQRSRPARRAST